MNGCDNGWADYMAEQMRLLREEFPNLPEPFLAGIWDPEGLTDYESPIVEQWNWPATEELPEVNDDEMEDLMKSIDHYRRVWER
jgi:hypothetical protein